MAHVDLARSVQLVSGLLVVWLVLVGAAPEVEDDRQHDRRPDARPWPGEQLAGGETTVFDESPRAFGRALATMPRSRRLALRAGKRLVDTPWSPPESSTTAPAASQSGLGPLFNAVACSSCHFRDGRGAPPAAFGEPPGPPPVLARLRRPGGAPDPVYGAQLNDRGVGTAPEGSLTVEIVEQRLPVDDGELLLRRPVGRVVGASRGPLHPETRVDLRIPPTLVGMGLLEAVPVSQLEALADPDDRDGDGISGRVRRVVDARGRQVVGRFGWTAAQPDLPSQIAGAFHEDLGVTSTLRPSADSSDVELDDVRLARAALYLRLLAPPARRDWDHPEVLRGRDVFTEVGCASCHVPTLRTASADELSQLPLESSEALLEELLGQTIRPYTDLLLHDLGPAMADGASEPGVEPGEWRTAPLWGLGLLERVNGHLHLLHDGRARSVTEAIEWHGGEASASRAAFLDLSPQDRAALVRFLETL